MRQRSLAASTRSRNELLRGKVESQYFGKLVLVFGPLDQQPSLLTSRVRCSLAGLALPRPRLWDQEGPARIPKLGAVAPAIVARRVGLSLDHAQISRGGNFLVRIRPPDITAQRPRTDGGCPATSTFPRVIGNLHYPRKSPRQPRCRVFNNLIAHLLPAQSRAATLRAVDE
jgi:hypothetical protein